MKPISPPRARASRGIVLGAVGLALLLTTACGIGDSTTGPDTVTTTGTSPPVSAPPPPTPPLVTPPLDTSDATTFTTLPMERCRTSGLDIAIAGQQGAAGSAIIDLEFRNADSRPCTLGGFPGISLIDAGGDQIGTAAVREGSAGETVPLGPDGRSSTSVRITRAENFDAAACGPVSATALRVYPPDSTVAVDLPLGSVSGCGNGRTNLLSVKSLTPVSLLAD